jgi:predicted AAA+ superfamily ATPase
MILRIAQEALARNASIYPLIILTGPRQSGKTSLAHIAFPDRPHISLDSPDTLESAQNDTKGFIAQYPEGAVIDDVHRCPELFVYLRDNLGVDSKKGLFILISAIHFDILRERAGGSERNFGVVRLLPFSFSELTNIRPFQNINELFFSGFYPPVHLKHLNPEAWYSEYIMNYMERDLRHIVNVRNLRSFRTFIRSCASHSGYLLNLSALADECGITHNTAKAWVEALESSHILFLLQPHTQAFGRRIVKSPKLYFYDVGLAAYLLGIRDPAQISTHVSWPYLFETFVISELVKTRFNAGLTSNLFFWCDSSGNEISIVAARGEALIPIRIKPSQAVSDEDVAILTKWRNLNKQTSLPAGLIYCGQDQMRLRGFTIYPWHEIGEFGPLFSGALKAYMRKN